eukprot:TRINITY_DN9735_c0_g1_i9.p1 TRINITY_DN9735_c0_g1~~TRINITY_DN9735_c0_g1_i9.p1  ORF type:complete len:549 (-),score=145.45 TRINITY_DN9735_c0_g1_i9:442-2088(-)
MQQAFEELATQQRLLFRNSATELFYSLSTSKSNVTTEERPPSSSDPHILILYVGGTLGMVKDPARGYIPKKGYLKQFMFHHPSFCDQEFTLKHAKDEYKDCFFAPLSIFNKRIRYQLKEFDPLLDSTDMTQKDWISIANEIASSYNDFDAFIILHGTDTIALTASALSFMLENLRKAVIITGSMIPLYEMRNDAVNNIVCSLLVAGHYWIPEVAVMMSNKLYRGNRTFKESSHDIEAMRSPKCPPLVNVETSIKVNWPLIHYVEGGEPLNVFTNIETRVSQVMITPYLTEKSFKAMMSSNFKGIVLETYGTGNFPSNRPELLEIIKNAVADGVLVINISQCSDAMVSDSLGDGKVLTDLGVINGRDMTPQCALTKLSYLLGKYSPAKARQYVQANLRGELTEDGEVIGGKPTVLSYSLMDQLTERMDVVLSVDKYKLTSSTVYPALVMQAAAEGNVQVLAKLSKEGASLEIPDPEFRTAVHVAALCGKREVIKYLLVKGVNIDRADRYSSSPLYYAIKKKRYEIAEDLLDAGGVFKCTYNHVISLLFS